MTRQTHRIYDTKDTKDILTARPFISSWMHLTPAIYPVSRVPVGSLYIKHKVRDIGSPWGQAIIVKYRLFASALDSVPQYPTRE